MKEELKKFNIDLDSIEESDNLFKEISKAIAIMRDEYEIKNIEVVLNGNLIIAKDKLKNYKTIFGVKISYQLLEENISFLVHEYTPDIDYEQKYFNLKEKVRDLMNKEEI